MLSGNALAPGTEIDSTFRVGALTVATESAVSTLNQNFRCEDGRDLIRCHALRTEEIWTAADLASRLISLFLVCFRFHVFSDLAILHRLPGGQGSRNEPVAAV